MYKSLSTASIPLHNSAPVKIRSPIFHARRLLMMSWALTRSQHNPTIKVVSLKRGQPDDGNIFCVIFYYCKQPFKHIFNPSTHSPYSPTHPGLYFSKTKITIVSINNINTILTIINIKCGNNITLKIISLKKAFS